MFRKYFHLVLKYLAPIVNNFRTVLKDILFVLWRILSAPFGLLLKLIPKGRRAVQKLLSDSMTQYILIIVSSISVFALFQPLYSNFQLLYPDLPPFILPRKPDDIDFEFLKSFVEWFGVLYGFLLPLVLVRVWEQFDEIDNVFDREADAIKILAEDILLLQDNFSEIRVKILGKLLEYVTHVQIFHTKESESKKKRRKKGKAPASDQNKDVEKSTKKDEGDNLLKEIRENYKDIIHQSDITKQEIPSLLSELLDKLNTIIDLRGDRISLSTERLFESLKSIAVVTTIIWIIPLYFLMFTGIGFFNIILIVCVIFLVIIILSIIDDLDKPFSGYWKVNIESWDKLAIDINSKLSDAMLYETNGIKDIPSDNTNQPIGESTPSAS